MMVPAKYGGKFYRYIKYAVFTGICMKKILPQKFFNRPTLEVAKDLLGKVLIHRLPLPRHSASNQRSSAHRELAMVITEVEAYDGFKDKASHASRGKTERNKIMFEQAGCFYVYFTYGIHYMLNIVTGPKNYPAAILIRGGIIADSKNFSLSSFHSSLLLSGPAKLTKFLKIDKKFNNLKATPKNNLWFEDRGIKMPSGQIIAKKRVGVEYAGKVWSNKKWNFSIKTPKY